jgi:hypothetical protein
MSMSSKTDRPVVPDFGKNGVVLKRSAPRDGQNGLHDARRGA